MKRNAYRLYVLMCFIAITLPYAVIAQSDKDGFSEKDNVLFLTDVLWIFPENKTGNSLYANKSRVVFNPEIKIISAVEADADAYVYLYVNQNEEYQLGFAGDSQARFSRLEGDFYYLVNQDKTRKSYFWINAEYQIEDLLPRYRTPAGFVYNGVDKAAFYHISKGETIEMEDGTLKYQYTFRLHVADRANFQVRDLTESIKDFRIRLKLEWLNPEELQYSLSSGETGIIEIQ